MTGVRIIAPDKDKRVFQMGGLESAITIGPGEVIDVDSEDAFSGRLTSVDGHPREVAPFPQVNPLTGPIEVRGARTGDVIAIHLLSLTPTRTWGVSTVSPNFGALSGTALSPNLQIPAEERVWIWTVEPDTATVSSPTPEGRTLRVPLRPFLGTLGIAPAHGEVRTSVVPDSYGGNLDIPALEAGATLFLRVNVPGAQICLGDGHYAQGDGEFTGTAVEGAMRTRLTTELLPPDELSDWPRIETDSELIAVGCGRPLEEAFKVAVHSLSKWVAQRSDLPLVEAYQLVSQACTARIGNLVNPTYTVTVAISKTLVGKLDTNGSTHERLRAARSIEWPTR
jgi:amidase